MDDSRYAQVEEEYLYEKSIHDERNALRKAVRRLYTHIAEREGEHVALDLLRRQRRGDLAALEVGANLRVGTGQH